MKRLLCCYKCMGSAIGAAIGLAWKIDCMKGLWVWEAAAAAVPLLEIYLIKSIVLICDYEPIVDFKCHSSARMAYSNF